MKFLDLDFSDRAWEEDKLHNHPDQELFVLPSDVYKHQVLESLKLFSCNFFVSSLTNLCMLRPHAKTSFFGVG